MHPIPQKFEGASEDDIIKGGFVSDIVIPPLYWVD